MGKSYSLDLRDRVVEFVEAGHSRRAAAGHFGANSHRRSKKAMSLFSTTSPSTGAPRRPNA